jgi:hypothetical protein
MRSRKNSKLFKVFLTVVLVFLCAVTFVNATVWEKCPEWENDPATGKPKRTLKVYVDPNASQDVKDATQDAVDEWNTGNGDWTLEVTNDANEADVNVSGDADSTQGNPPSGYAKWTPKQENGKEVVDKFDVTVEDDEGISKDIITALLLHELGHCMRIHHSTDAADIMCENIQVYEISDGDTKEAESSAKFNVLVAEPSDCMVFDTPIFMNLDILPDSGITLDEVIQIWITPLNGPDFSSMVLGWTPMSIQAEFTAFPSAAHNEVALVETLDIYSQIEEFTVVMYAAPQPPPPGEPHAMAGPDMVVPVGVPFVLDGYGSFHDDPSQEMVADWKVLDEITGEGTGQVDFEVELVLDLPGIYTATLTVMDYYGRTSEDTLEIEVQ